MRKRQTKRLVAVCCCTFLAVVVMCVVSYFLVEFRRAKHVFGFRNRKSTLTQIAAVFGLLYMATRIWSMWNLLLIWSEPYSYNGRHEVRDAQWSTGTRVLLAFYGLMVAFSLIGYAVSTLTRVWALYYDSRLAIASSDKLWLTFVSQPPSLLYVDSRERALLRAVTLTPTHTAKQPSKDVLRTHTRDIVSTPNSEDKDIRFGSNSDLWRSTSQEHVTTKLSTLASMDAPILDECKEVNIAAMEIESPPISSTLNTTHFATSLSVPGADFLTTNPEMSESDGKDKGKDKGQLRLTIEVELPTAESGTVQVVRGGGDIQPQLTRSLSPCNLSIVAATIKPRHSSKSTRKAMIRGLIASAEPEAQEKEATAIEQWATAELSWYLSNKSVYGSPYRVLLRLAMFSSPFFIGIVTLFCTAPRKLEPYVIVVFLLYFVPLLLFLIGVWYKYPSKGLFEDSLRVYDELRLLAHVSVLMLVSICATGIVILVSEVIGSGLEQNARFYLNLTGETLAVLYFAVNVTIQTEWVRRQFHSELEKQSVLRHKHHQKMTVSTFSRFSRGSTKSKARDSSKLKSGFSSKRSSKRSQKLSASPVHRDTIHALNALTLSDIVDDVDMFRTFMKHLFKEFCYENALCLYEFLALKRLLLISTAIRWDADGNAVVERDKWEHLQFAIAERMPSAIVTHKLLSNEQKYACLCDKYVDKAAELCVNLSSRCRAGAMRRCDQFINGEDSLQHTDMDAVIGEVLKLLRSSLRRFKECPSAVVPTVTIDSAKK